MFLDARIVYDYGRVVHPFLKNDRLIYLPNRQSAIRVKYLPVTFENKCDVSSIELKVDVQYIHSGINIIKFSDNSLFYWRFGQLWTDNAPYVTNEPSHDKTNKVTVRPAKTQIGPASAQSDQSLRCALNG